MNILDEYLLEQEEDLASVMKNIKNDMGISDNNEKTTSEEEPVKEDTPEEDEEGSTDEPIEGEEEIEEEDISVLPYADKIKTIMTLIKEFGFSNIDYQIDEGKNNIIIKGKLESADKTTLKGLTKELDIQVEIEESQVEGDKIITKLKFVNNITLDQFLKINDKIKKDEEEASMMDMGGGEVAQ